jgi:DNA-directed RNA polymerase subunit F
LFYHPRVVLPELFKKENSPARNDQREANQYHPRHKPIEASALRKAMEKLSRIG